MTAVDPQLGTLTQVLPALPKLRSLPSRRRALWKEMVDAVAVVVNRGLDRFAFARAVYRKVLARTEFTTLDHPVVGQPGLDGLRIAFLTDLHVGSYLDEDGLLELCERVVALEPDLICLGGDLINSRAEELQLLDAPMRALRAPLGVFAVPGNHDHRWSADMGEWQDFLEHRGVQVIANRGVRVRRGGSSLWLCGVDDLTDGEPDVAAALRGRADGEPCVMLAHQPDHFVEAREHGIDLVLSGHTHGGQVRLFGWTPVAHTRHGYVAGGFAAERGRLYVSRGIGATILPLRIGARPEIPVIRLRSSAASD